MTVADVIKILSTFPGNMEVKVATLHEPSDPLGWDDFGDYALKDIIIDISPYDIVVIDYL